MTNEEFKERWEFATRNDDRLKSLFYKKPHKSGLTRDEVFKESSKRHYTNAEIQKRFHERHKNEIEYKELKRKNSKQYHEKNKNDETYKEKKRENARRHYQKQLEIMRQRVQDQKILLENDEPTRAMEELARFTPEERKRYDEWEKKERTAS